MRKAKPKKKREIKHNNPEPVPCIPAPTEAEILDLETRTHLMNLNVVLKKHKAIWDREIEENDGYLAPKYWEIIEKLVYLSNKIYQDLYPCELFEIEVTPYIKMLMVRYVSICAPAFGDPVPESMDDRLQRVPAGFMGTTGVMAELINILMSNRLYNNIKRMGKEKELMMIADLSEQYFLYLARDIMFMDEFINSWKRRNGMPKKVNGGKTKEELFLERIFADALPEEDTKAEATKEEIKEVEAVKEEPKEEIKEEPKKVKKEVKTVKKDEKSVEKVKKEVKTVKKTVKSVKKDDDPVKPNHYKLANGLSAGDVIEFVIRDCKGRTAWKLGTVLKYLIRAERKAGAEDYKKADEYLNMILAEDYWRAEICIPENFREEFEKEYGKSWFSVLYAIAEDLPGGKALALNEIFECILKMNLEDAKKRIQDVLSFC